MVEIAYDPVGKIANSDPENLLDELVRVNEAKGIFKRKFGLDDMRCWVENVFQDVPRVMHIKNRTRMTQYSRYPCSTSMQDQM